MAIRKVIYFPDKLLRQRSKEIDEITPEIKKLASDMIETMQHYNGIGLAAIQIGVPLRLFVMDRASIEIEADTTPLTPEENPEPLVIINPEILWFSREKHVYKEGCLSVPDFYAEVERPTLIYLRYQDLNNEIQQIELQGLLSTCAQHEIDHLDGLLFLDHLTRIRRDRIISKFLKQSKMKK